MRYVSTRNTAKTYDFKDVFIKGLADDGGLFIPSSLPKYSEKEIQELKSLNYSDLAKKIIFPFIGNFMDKNELSKIIDKSYSVFRRENVIDFIKIGDRSVLELFHGPTLAFKDVAMQLLGNFYEFYLSKQKEKINIVVATSGDTGAAAIDAIKGKENLNIFEQNQDKNDRISKKVENIFYPVPSIHTRENNKKIYLLTLPNISRVIIFFMIFNLSIIFKGVHGNAGKPLNWFFPPVE